MATQYHKILRKAFTKARQSKSKSRSPKTIVSHRRLTNSYGAILKVPFHIQPWKICLQQLSELSTQLEMCRRRVSRYCRKISTTNMEIHVVRIMAKHHLYSKNLQPNTRPRNSIMVFIITQYFRVNWSLACNTNQWKYGHNSYDRSKQWEAGMQNLTCI